VASQAPGNLGPYRLLNVVHTGSASRIWQAYDDQKQEMVGLKTLQDKFHKGREQLGYLKWEYSVAQKVAGDRLIRVFAFDTDRGTPYLAMEWFAARNMKQRIRDGIDKIDYLLPKVIEQSAEALGCFNAAGWVHRDVKPDNFLVADDGTVKLIDFALARRRKGGLGKLFAGKWKVQGTRSYMSPEQIRGAALDQRADIYGFGCTIHELLSGKPPFTGSTPAELLKKHLKQPPPSLEVTNPNVTVEFAQLVRQCLAKNPAQRPETLDDFLLGLRMKGVFKAPPQGPEEEP